MAIKKDHANALAMKAGAYYKAKCLPKNFCRKPEDVDEGRDLLKAFDDAVDDGMDPDEGSSLVCKCAGSMGGAMSGPLAATMATRPVKHMANGTILEQRPIGKSHHDATFRESNGKLVPVAAYDDAVHAAQPPAKAGKKVGHYAVHEGKTKWTEGHAPEGAKVASLAERTAMGVNKNKGWYLRAANKADANAIKEAIYKVTGETMEPKQGGAVHHGNDSAFPHFFFGHGAAGGEVAAKVMAVLHGAEVPKEAPVPEPVKVTGISEDALAAKEASEEADAYSYSPTDDVQTHDSAVKAHQDAAVAQAKVAIGSEGDAQKEHFSNAAYHNQMAKYHKGAGLASAQSEEADTFHAVSSKHNSTEHGAAVAAHDAAANSHQAILDADLPISQKLKDYHQEKAAQHLAAKAKHVGFAIEQAEGEVEDAAGDAAYLAAQPKSAYEMGQEAHAKGLSVIPSENKDFMDSQLKPGAPVGSNIDAMKGYQMGWHSANAAALVPDEDGPKVGDTKTENGKQFVLNENHHWELAIEQHPEEQGGGSMPTVAELAGVGKEWTKGAKHRIYFNAKDHLQAGLSYPGGKVWYEFADGKMHTKDLGVSGNAVIESIKKAAKEWGTKNAQVMPDTDVLDWEEAHPQVQEARGVVKGAGAGFKDNPTPGGASDLAHAISDLAGKITAHHPEATGHASDAHAYSEAAQYASGNAANMGDAESHLKAAGAHGKAGVYHAQLGNSFNLTDTPIKPGPAHLQSSHTAAAKAHAALAEYHGKMADSLGQTPKVAVKPDPFMPKPPSEKWHEHDWDAATKPIMDGLSDTHLAITKDSGYTPSKKELESYVQHAKHLALVAGHKAKQGLPNKSEEGPSWGDFGQKWAGYAKKAMTKLKEME